MSSIEKAIDKLASKQAQTRQQNSERSVSIKTNKLGSKSVGVTTRSPNKQISILPILEDSQMLTPALDNSRQVEEYRIIKRPILAHVMEIGRSQEEKSNVVMITSAFPGEGKTYTTINLAMSIATERDCSVLVIDCDVEKRALSLMLGLENELGLLDSLLDEGVTIGDIIVSTDVPSLKIIPAGGKQNYSTELLASEEMGRVIGEISRRYPDRIIILDSPPLLMTSQSVVLTTYADQILVVVEEGVTPQKAVLEAISKLNDNKIIGTILNKRSRINRGEQYGEYYGSYGE